MIDIQFQPNVPLEAIEAFAAEAIGAYPKQSAIWQAYVSLPNPGEAGAVVSPASPFKLGVRLDSDDGQFVVQARVNGFTVSRLNPYGQWGDLKGEAERWWKVFSTFAQAEVVTRVAVRYINAINVTLPFQDFSHYLTSAPVVPLELSQGLSSFLYRVEIPDEPTKTMSVVTQALEPLVVQPDGGLSLPIVLDVDVFRSLHLAGGQHDAIWPQLDQLRDQKNRIFFAYITEQTAEMFE